MATSSNRTHTSPERSLTLQKYLLLRSQHDALQRNLHSITTDTHPNSYSPSNVGPPTPASIYASLPPDHNHSTTAPASPISSSPTPTPWSPLSASLPSATSPIACAAAMAFTGEDLSSEQAKLKSVNQQIKSTLTELLNCEGVRRDREYRMWVQGRLMAAERELRGGRRENCCERRRGARTFAA